MNNMKVWQQSYLMFCVFNKITVCKTLQNVQQKTTHIYEDNTKNITHKGTQSKSKTFEIKGKH